MALTPASLAELGDQLDVGLRHHDLQASGPQRMTINFVARGQILFYQGLMHGFKEFADVARIAARTSGLEPPSGRVC